MRWGGRGVISRQYSVLRIGGDWGNAIPDRVLTEIKPRVDAAVVPRSLHSANRHAETACKKKPVRSGRDDNLAVHEDHGSDAPERGEEERIGPLRSLRLRS